MRSLIVALAAAGLLGGCGVFRPFRENVAVLQDRATQEEFDAWADSMKGADAFSTAQNLAAWGKANITYVADGVVDYPRDYLVTFKRRSGDCDDFSSMYMAALMRAGFDADLLSVWHSGGGHAVCAFKHGNFYYHISNWSDMVWGGAADRRALSSTVYSDWTRYVVRNFDMEEIEGGDR